MPRQSSCLCLAVVGLLLTACDNSTPPTAPGETASPVAAAAAASSPALTLFQVSAGFGFTCAITTDNVPYCWGADDRGQLGIGDTVGFKWCAGNSTPCVTKPTQVAGNHRFARVSAGARHACGVTADFEGWCWGNNNSGELGNGTTNGSFVPLHVNGLRFRQLEAGDGDTCGVTYPDNKLYCWGFDVWGRLGLGNGMTIVQQLTPAKVLTTLTFKQVVPGSNNTCAITTTTGRAFCWGSNVYGQVGDSTNASFRDRPAEVVGKHVFRQIDVGEFHVCAVTTADKAFCWGRGTEGAIGNGHRYLSFWPRAVSGGLQVRRVTTGGRFSCAETTSNKAYCWGIGNSGELGNGSPVSTVALTPVPVSGNHAFAQLNAGAAHVCGKITLGFGWCWGDDLAGELGNGTTASHVLTPVRVVGP